MAQLAERLIDLEEDEQAQMCQDGWSGCGPHFDTCNSLDHAETTEASARRSTPSEREGQMKRSIITALAATLVLGADISHNALSPAPIGGGRPGDRAGLDRLGTGRKFERSPRGRLLRRRWSRARARQGSRSEH